MRIHFLLFLGMAAFFNGCSPTGRATREEQGLTVEQASPTPPVTVTADDSIRQGPTKREERDSVNRQKAIVNTVVFVSVMVVFIATLAWAGPDR